MDIEIGLTQHEFYETLRDLVIDHVEEPDRTLLIRQLDDLEAMTDELRNFGVAI